MRDKFVGYFGDKIPSVSGKVMCCWHDDKEPSLHLDYEKGRVYCFSCGANHSIDELVDGYDKEIALETIRDFHQKLMGDSEKITRESLAKIKGWTEDTLKKLMIGWNGNRFSFPIWSDCVGGKCINVRLYRPGGAPKIMSFGPGYGANVWFPCPPNREDEIYLMEGEPDTITARQLGLAAFCQTGGAQFWSDKFTADIAGKRVNVIYDQDRTGVAGARLVVNRIKWTSEVRNIRLPVSSEAKDFTDWTMKDQGNIAQLREIVAVTAPYAVSKMEGSIDDTIVLPLFETASARWAFRGVECDVVVAGKDRSPYMIPYRYIIECTPNRKKNPLCAACPAISGRTEMMCDWRDGKITRFVDLPDNYRDTVLKELCGVPFQCKSSRATVTEYQNIEKLALYPRKDVLLIDTEQPVETNMLRKAYFLGMGMHANATYRAKGIPVPDTRDQTSVLLIVEAEPVDTVEEVTDLSLCECFRLEPKEKKDADHERRCEPPGELRRGLV